MKGIVVTSKAQCEGQTPSLAMASWLLGTVNCLQYFGSCLGRGQELSGSALGACFCLLLEAFSLKGKRTWLSCIYQWRLLWARNVLLLSACPEASRFRKEGAETSPPSPEQPFPCLPLPHTARAISVGKQCRGWKGHGHIDHSIIKNAVKNLCCFYYSCFAQECCPYWNFKLLSCKK